jgi:hypothetical protein
MKQKPYKITAAVFALVVIGLAGVHADDSEYGARGAEGRSELSLEQMLVYSIEDEYLARAEYGRMRPFSNVVEAEGRHIGWLQELFQEYQLAVPEEGAAVHVVLPDSLEAAIEAGVQAELDNIGMYESFLTRDLPADVREVFERLEGASKNHLQAFRRQLQRFN